MIRRFEYVADTSAKFWEVETDGRQVKVRYGRIGRERPIANEVLHQRNRGRRTRQETDRRQARQGLQRAGGRLAPAKSAWPQGRRPGGFGDFPHHITLPETEDDPSC